MQAFQRMFSNPALRISLIYIGFASAWILFSDQLLAWLMPEGMNLTLLQSFKGLGFVAVTGIMLYWLIRNLRTQPSQPYTGVGDRRGRKFLPLYLFAVLSVGISATGWLTYGTLRTSMSHEAIDQITLVGKLRQEQINIWVKETLRDGDLLAQNSILAKHIADWLANSTHDETLQSALTQRLHNLAGDDRYTGVILFDREGRMVISPDLPEAEVTQHRADAMAAMREKKSRLVDFHFRDAEKHIVELGLASPIMIDGQVVGALYFSINPTEFLYPMLQTWPVASKSAESLLVRRDGDLVTYLSPLRDHRILPLTFQLPIRSNVAAAIALSAKSGLSESLDYRGTPIFAYQIPVTNTGWVLISKMDREEALISLRNVGRITAMTTLFLLGIATSVLWIWWRREQMSFAEKLSLEKQVIAQQYDMLTRYANDAILLVDDRGKILEVNDRAVEMYGFPRDELIGLDVCRLRSPAAQADFDTALERIRTELTCIYETEHQNQNGRTFPVEVSTRRIEHNGRTVIHAILRDITERRLAQARIERLSQLNATLSHVNEAIVHMGDDADEATKLYRLVCQIAVQHGGMKMAWIGLINPETSTIDPVAWTGDGTDYLRDITISTRADIPEGRGPTGTAGREGRAHFIENFPNDPATAPWHARAFRYGWGSSAALPVQRGGRPHAVLTIYHGDLNAFDQESIALLQEISGDLSFALDTLDARSAARKVEEKLRIASMVVESSPAVLWRWRAAEGWPTEFVSENVVQFGYGADEFTSGKRHFADIIHPDDLARVFAEVQKNSASGVPQYSQQYRILRWDGEVRWLDDRTTVIRDDQGNITHYQGITYDVTERVEVEQALAASEARLNSIGNNLPDGYIYQFVMDADGSDAFSYISAGVKLIHGLDPEDVLHDPALLFQQILPDSMQAYTLATKTALENMSVFSCDMAFVDKYGQSRWIRAQSMPHTVGDGTIAWDGVVVEITAQRESETKLKETVGLLHLALEGGQEALWDWSLISGQAMFSDEYFTMLGYEPYEFPSTQEAWESQMHPEDKPRVLAQIASDIEQHKQNFVVEYRMRAKDGSYIWILGRGKATAFDADGRATHMVGTNINITERKTAELKLQLDAEVFRHSTEGIVITDATTRILTVNHAFCRISGYTEEEAIGQTTRLLKSDRHDDSFYQELWQNLLNDGMWQGEIWNRRKNGEVYPEWLHITAVSNEAGEVSNFIGVFSDLTQSKQMQERITQLSRYDPVTGLPNMFFFDDLLAMAINDAEQQRHRIAVLRLDIENFHSIDDTYGFETGDLALKVIAERLVKTVGNDGIVTRMAKDNFSIAYPRIRDITHATQLADRLQHAISETLLLGEHEIHPGANIGISFYPSDGELSKDLVQRAGIALNHAKADKVANLRFFEQAMNDQLLAKIGLTNDIRRAIEREEFELYYQPQIDLANGKVTGLEALVRWNHPTQGFLPPCEFVQLAEESGLILPLGDWILKRAMLQMKEWRTAGLTELAIAVAVNASAMQMESGDMVDTLQKLLKEIDLPPECIELELTESLLMNNVGATQSLLQRLKAMGVRLSIDDFGTGYSSLSYLKQFSVDKLKIDKSFIDHITTDPNDAVIVQATIAMARSMGLKVIAEGVETEAQANYLRNLQCDEIQGYLFSRPLPAAEILPLLRKNTGVGIKAVSEHSRVLLLVDDEPNVLSSLKRILRRDGYEILTAGSGAEGLEMLASHPVGVIISDQRMPEMSGVEFLSRARIMHPESMRIVLSGYTEVNTITDAVNKGAVYKFLTKPWDDDELREVIRKAFKIHEENKQKSVPPPDHLTEVP